MLGSANENSAEAGSVPRRRVYSIPEVAELLAGVSVRYVWDLVGRGDLESIKIGARRVVPAEALEAFIARLREDEQRLRAAAVA